MVLAPLALAADTDGDGVDDSLDDCPVAEGNSTVDRTGCPDKDGDGTSDKNDPWTFQSGVYSQDSYQSSNDDYYISLFSKDGNSFMTSDGSTLRIWDATSKPYSNLKSATVSGLYDVAWSPDGVNVGALDDNDQLIVYYTTNISVMFTISVDVGSGDQAKEVEYSPDGSMIAVVVGRSGNQGTNGEVQIYNSSDGTEIISFTPGSEDRFESVDWSPDGSRLLIGGDEDIWVYDTSSWTQNATRNTNRGSINAIAWSPDGNSIAVCEAWESNGARIRMIDYHSMNERWVYPSSTSCNDIEFSPDSTHVAAAHTYYQSDGASIRIFKTYDTSPPTVIETLSAPRPGGCTSGGNGNNCGSIYGLDWHPNGIHIISAHGRNDEGIYHWMNNPDRDYDGVLNQDDIFPDEGSQWNDTDNDGFGDNPAPAWEPDACPTVPGTSTQDRFGCPDDDGDGYSDEGDVFTGNSNQWADSDGDGYGDNNVDGVDYVENSSTTLRENQTGDAFPYDLTQWNDTDGDGRGDNYLNTSWSNYRLSSGWPGELLLNATNVDAFPLDRTQWTDTDGDWIGDEQMSDRSDGCPLIWGNSLYDRLGCIDTDGDGWSDPDAGWPAKTDCYGADAFPTDPTQWCDEDEDGFGSNQTGNNSDACPNQVGTSTEDRRGCSDRDGDGYSNAGDPFPDDGSQWADRDGDNRGDNPNGTNADIFPDDTSQWMDSDDDGYGDNQGGLNGDAFPYNPKQWADTDGDGYGDNLIDDDGDGITEGNSDVCPLVAGTSVDPISRGCTDSDQDGYVDPVDVFPLDPFQWSDTDGDGYGDNSDYDNGDDCVDIYGKSNKNYLYGCPDSDFDGWADSEDAFPMNTLQWEDSDGDGYGDNYDWKNETILDLDNPGQTITIRNQSGDAFPLIKDQWSDIDGDGWGDNQTSFYQPDAFVFEPSQWLDFDGDGYGDNATFDAFEPDGCRKEAGTSIGNLSLKLDWGCPDFDNDGIQNPKDPCPWDPEVTSGVLSGPNAVKCMITSEPSVETGEKESAFGFSAGSTTSLVMGGSIVFLLSLIFVAQLAKASSKRKHSAERALERKTDIAFSEDEERRLAWIEHYVAAGQLDEARALGWTEEQATPQWKQFEMQQQATEEASVPTMFDLNQL